MTFFEHSQHFGAHQAGGSDDCDFHTIRFTINQGQR